MTQDAKPDIQLISNVVILNDKQEVLLTRYDPDDERWWIPGATLEPYEHPDAAARRALADVGLANQLTATLNHVESFRGRRGWHVMFNYIAHVGLLAQRALQADTQWFPLNSLPATNHGEWEKALIDRSSRANA